jgi:uncharacterized protein (DUF1800 family)
MKNYFLISLLLIISSGLNSATASFIKTLSLYSPVEAISFYSDNLTNSQEVVNGNNIIVKAVTDKGIDVQAISFAEKILPYEVSCNSINCSYNFKINVQEDFTPTAVLKISFYDNSSKELKSLSLSNIPIKKIESAELLSDLININFQKTSQPESRTVTNNESLNFEMISAQPDFNLSIQSLELLGINIKLEDIKEEAFTINGKQFYKFYITVVVPADYVKEDFDFNLKIKNNLGKIISFNDSNYFNPIKILNNSSTLDPSLQLKISSSRDNNSITASNDDQFTISINTSEPDTDISSVSIDGSDLMKDMKATCNGNNCSYIFKYTPPIQNSDVNFKDLNLVYTTEKSLHNTHSDLITVRDYQQLNFLSRLTFGMNDDINSDILKNGKEAFINKQLNPLSIDNSNFMNTVDDYRLLANNANSVRAWVTKFFLLSKTQFQERLAYFWMNHFNTFLSESAKNRNSRYWKFSNNTDFSAKQFQVFGLSLVNTTPDASFYLDSKYLPNIVNLKDYGKLNIIATYRKNPNTASTVAKIMLEGKDVSNQNISIEMLLPEIILDDTKKIIELNLPEEALKLEKITKISFFPSNTTNVSMILNGIELSQNNGLSKFLFSGSTILSARDYLFFRDNALGNFKKLLAYSAKSQNMLVYLDVVLNVKTGINENYAREVLELHTVSLQANYTDGDVKNLSKFFTGMDFIGEYFFLNPDTHLNGDLKLSIFSNSFPGSNQADLETFLSGLAEHPNTAKHICSKLLEILVSEEPLETSIEACADVFLQNKDSENQIKNVITFIINSTEFSSGSSFENKISNPLIYYSNFYRSLNTTNLNNKKELSNLINSVDYNLLGNAVPTGYEEKSLQWFNPNIFNKEISNINGFLASNSTLDADIFTLIDNNLTIYNTDTIAAFILTRFASSSFTQEEFSQIKSLLGANFTYTKTADVANKIRDAIFVASLSASAQKN